MRRRDRAVLRTDWMSLAPGRSLRWWAAFAFEVKGRGIRHSDRATLKAVVRRVDEQFRARRKAQ